MEPGTRLGAYEILEPLGDGGMGGAREAGTTRLYARELDEPDVMREP